MAAALNPSLLSWLRCFDAAARCASFTQAASQLCVTQGAVSQQVKQLEQWLNRPLFLRSPRALVLTPEGLRLANVLHEAFDMLEDELLQLRRPAAGAALVLSCAPSFAMGWLTPRLGDFYRQHPALDLKVISEFQALDRSGMALAGLAAAVRYDLGGYSDLQSQPFLDEWLLPVASPGWLQAHPQVCSAADLRPEHLLHDDQAWAGADPHEEWRSWLQAAGLPHEGLEAGRHFNLSQLATGAALAGQGVALGRLALVLDELQAGRLCAPWSLPQRRALHARGAYQLVMPEAEAAGVAELRAWLLQQAESYARRRDAWLSGSASTAR